MRKKIYIFVLFLIASLSVVYAQDAEFCTKREANHFLFGNNKMKQVKWQFVQSYDPYNGGITTPADISRPESYLFQKNGKMLIYSADNQQHGKWRITEEKQFLWIEYAPEKNKKELYKFKIKELTAEKMILAIQGRHGMVERTYLKIKN
jgi:hypothetical protein